MKIKMMNNKIGVVKIGKTAKKDENILFATVEVADNLGIIEFVPDNCTYKIGTKVYYGSKREQIRMQGIDVQIMNEDNIFAIVEESNEKPTQTEEK